MTWEKPEGEPEKKRRFSLRKIGKMQWVSLALLGILLVVIAIPAGGGEEESRTSVFPGTEEEDTGEETSVLEKKLGRLLQQVEGVGEVEVMIYPGHDRSSLLHGEEEQGEISGALIVAEGAGDPVVVQKIQEAVMALFQVDAHNIKVMKMK